MTHYRIYRTGELQLHRAEPEIYWEQVVADIFWDEDQETGEVKVLDKYREAIILRLFSSSVKGLDGKQHSPWSQAGFQAIQKRDLVVMMLAARKV